MSAALPTNSLRRYRKARGWSQQDIADLVGTTQSQIDRLEKDGIPGVVSRKLTKQWAIKLAQHLDLTWQALMEAPPVEREFSYDPECEMLALHFLSDDQDVPKLAQAIQDAVEDFISGEAQ